MELIERIPLRAIKWLSQLSYDEFVEQCISNPKKKKDKEKCLSTYSQFKQYCQTNLKTGGITTRIYSHSLNTPAGLGGRLFSGCSLQGLPGTIRGLLMKNGFATDLDQVNAHPRLLKYICIKHYISCPHLDYYLNNRDECLAKFESREEGKIAYLTATNKNTLNKKRNLPDEFKKYDKEMKEIQKKLLEIPEYTQLFDTIPHTKTYNYNGAAINRILCYYENIVLQHAIHILNKNGIEICALMFDGLMMYGDHYKNDLLLNEITKYVEKQMPGLNMQWSYKPHNEYLEIPDDFDDSKVVGVGANKTNFICNDLDAAKKLFKLYPFWKYCDNQLFVFDDTTGLWKNDKNTYNIIVSRFTDQLWVGVKGKNTDELEASKVKSYGNTSYLLIQMLDKLKTLCVDDTWELNAYNKSLGKLLFKNGYFDMKTNTFHDKFNPGIYFVGKIDHDYLPFSSEEETYIDSIKYRLFYESLGNEMGDFFIYNLSRGLAGDMMKRILFGLGRSDSGKSTVTKAFLKACGDYVGTFDGNNFAYRNTGNDCASQNRWLMLLKHKRIIFSNEIKSANENKSKISLNGNLIKTVSSGGDAVVGRAHSGNECEFYLSFLCVLFANDLPSIVPNDEATNNRTRVVSYNKIYKINPNPEASDELQADLNIDAEMDTLLFQRCFLEIFIRQYKKGLDGEFKNEPTEVIQAKEDWIGTEVGCIPSFIQEYEITNNVEDYVTSKEIEEWLETGKFGITMKKFGMELRLYLIKKKFDNVKSIVKKINGKSPHVWVGIKQII